MGYLFKGKLCSYICSECSEPLRRVKVRLYSLNAREEAIDRAVASAKDTFAILDDEAVKAKKSLLIAEAETDAEGNYSFDLGDQQKYQGEAFEVDVYIDSVEGQENNRNFQPVQFTITVLRPQWREIGDSLVWGWDYCLSYRWWCLILARLNIWVICGQVVLCNDRKTGFPGVKVIAFDRDWLQDDALGLALTDSSGRFHIYYTRANFKPGLIWNVELFGGPDVYFRVETSIGAPILVEPPSRGRAPDRENRGNCFCVTLCVDRENPPDPPLEPNPDFYKIGVYDYNLDIDSAPAGTGRTNGSNRAFYSDIRLNGILSRTLNNNPMEYRFEVSPLDAMGNPIAWAKVTPAQIAKTTIGVLQKDNPNFPALEPWRPYLYFPCVTSGPLGPNEFLPSGTNDAFGDWIQVPQGTNSSTTGFFDPGPNMIMFRTTTVAPVVEVDLTVPTVLEAGNSVTSTGKALEVNKHFAIRMFVREVGSGTAGTASGTCRNVAIENSLYKTKNHPGWMETNPVANGVAMVDITQMAVTGCDNGGIQDDLDVVFTAAHPNLGGISLGMTGPGGPYSFTLPPATTPGKDHFGTAAPNFTVSDLEKCAYIVTFGAQVLLTTGDSVPDNLVDQIAFCKA